MSVCLYTSSDSDSDDPDVDSGNRKIIDEVCGSLFVYRFHCERLLRLSLDVGEKFLIDLGSI